MKDLKFYELIGGLLIMLGVCFVMAVIGIDPLAALLILSVLLICLGALTLVKGSEDELNNMQWDSAECEFTIDLGEAEDETEEVEADKNMESRLYEDSIEMTNEEALALLKDHEYWAGASVFDEMAEVAIKALEKQIPKKPIGDLHSVPHYRCSVCNCSVKTYNDSPLTMWCLHCGQAIDWGKSLHDGKEQVEA